MNETPVNIEEMSMWEFHLQQFQSGRFEKFSREMDIERMLNRGL